MKQRPLQNKENSMDGEKGRSSMGTLKDVVSTPFWLILRWSPLQQEEANDITGDMGRGSGVAKKRESTSER